MFDRWGFRLQAPEGDGTGGSGGKPDMMEQARRKLDRQRNATKLVADLLSERFEDREEIRKLRGQVEAGGVPKGSIVLSGDDAKLWEKVKAFGKPDAVEAALTEHPVLLQFKNDSENTARVRNVARAMGDWNPDVLVDITTARGLEYEDKPVTIRDAEGKEEEKRVPHVRVRGAKEQKWERLDQFAARELKDYETALRSKNGNGSGGSSSTSVPFPAQPSHDQGSGGKDRTAAFIQQRYGPKQEPAK